MEELNIVDKILLFISAICIIVALAVIPYRIYNHSNRGGIYGNYEGSESEGKR